MKLLTCKVYNKKKWLWVKELINKTIVKLKQYYIGFKKVFCLKYTTKQLDFFMIYDTIFIVICIELLGYLVNTQRIETCKVICSLGDFL